MRRRTAAMLAMCATLAAGAAAAAEVAPQSEAAPVILDIAFEGNEVTQPKVMLREMVVAVGDRATPEAIERSRQGVQDLGLFRTVFVRTEPVEGGVRLVFVVKEKFYVLPLPRLDASSDGGYAYGVQLRWSNVGGLNHTLNPFFEIRQPSEGDADPEKRGEQKRAALRYRAPYVFDTPWALGLNVEYANTPYLEPLMYEERVRVVAAGLSRKVSDGPGSQGWFAGGGIHWRSLSLEGPDAAAVREEGKAISASAGVSYRDLHFNVYSEQGLEFSTGIESAGRDWGSDYQFTTLHASGGRYWAVGETPHQSLHLLADVSARHGGPPGGQPAYSLGGAGSLRGFEPETLKGDLAYLVSVEYLRPVFRRSIRLLAVVDAGYAFPRPGDLDFERVLVSAGIGVRVRFTAFVSLEFELGVAWPLNGGGARVFATKV